jgi:hypothetical protein
MTKFLRFVTPVRPAAAEGIQESAVREDERLREMRDISC